MLELHLSLYNAKKPAKFVGMDLSRDRIQGVLHLSLGIALIFIKLLRLGTCNDRLFPHTSVSHLRSKVGHCGRARLPTPLHLSICMCFSPNGSHLLGLLEVAERCCNLAPAEEDTTERGANRLFARSGGREHKSHV